MGTLALLLIALAAIAVLLVLVIKLEFSAYVSLLLVAMGTALVAGVPIAEVVPTMIEGMGKVLGSVAIIVGLGSMLGRMIEVSGGADALANRFTQALGPKWVIAAVTAAAFILGIPIFFDVGFIILAPIVFAFAKTSGLHPLKFGLPVGGVLLTVHVALPPHPGPVAAAAQVGADVGLMTLIGLVICAIVGVLGYLIAARFRVERIQLADSPALAGMTAGGSTGGSADTSAAIEDRQPATGSAGSGGTATLTKRTASAGLVSFLILLPIVMIMAGSVAATALEKGHPVRDLAGFIGQPTTALLVGVIVAYFTLGSRMGWNKVRRTEILDSALPMVAIIIFVTGAGGVFGNVLVKTGIGKALAESLHDMGLPLIVAGYIICLALRAAQGSATVAILTAGGLLQPAIAAGNYSSLQVVILTLAICFGGLGLSHINDSGFWIVTKWQGLSVADGLKTWTVLTTVMSLIGFGICCLIWLVI
ncbi:MAG: GntP family transporter [Austwickia sp.]|nr:GntP family transporter [Austwickia sp.]